MIRVSNLGDRHLYHADGRRQASRSDVRIGCCYLR